MSLRNYFYRFGKYILTFFFVTLLMVLFGPLRAQAAITKEVTSDGFKLSGMGSMNVWDGDEFRYYIGYQIPHEDSMDYKVDVTMTFQSSSLTPGRASVYLDDRTGEIYRQTDRTGIGLCIGFCCFAVFCRSADCLRGKDWISFPRRARGTRVYLFYPGIIQRRRTRAAP